MSKKALNIQIDETLYDEIRAVSFIRKEPIAVVVRNFLRNSINEQKQSTKEKMELILDTNDEKKILEILAKDEWISEEDFMKDNNLSYHK